MTLARPATRPRSRTSSPTSESAPRPAPAGSTGAAIDVLPRNARIVLRVVLAACAALGLWSLVLRTVGPHATEPIDLDINLVAAEQLADGSPLYDADDSLARAVELGGEDTEALYGEPTSSFVGPPTTALLHLPWTALDHDVGVALFRLTSLGGLAGAIALVARCLPIGLRLDGFLVGVGAVAVSPATAEMVVMGQGHHLVVLGLAVAMWGIARDRWWIVGAALGVAALLKLTPALFVVYLVARGRKQVVPGFVASVVGLVAASCVVGGRVGDLVVWTRDVLPGISQGVLRTSNQSLPAALQRLVSPPGELAGTAAVGPIRMVAVPLLLVGAAALWRARRGRAVDPRELGVLVLLGLALGPLTWTHYVTWACLPLVLLVGTRRRPVLVGAAAVVALLAVPVRRPGAEDVAAHAALRLTTNPSLGAVLLLLLLCTVDLVAPTGAIGAGASLPPPCRAHPVDAGVCSNAPPPAPSPMRLAPTSSRTATAG